MPLNFKARRRTTQWSLLRLLRPPRRPPCMGAAMQDLTGVTRRLKCGTMHSDPDIPVGPPAAQHLDLWIRVLRVTVDGNDLARNEARCVGCKEDCERGHISCG